jgi:mevalonate kinase
MTQDEIIDMAMKAEFVSHGKPSEEDSELFVCTDKDIVHFAKLIAKAEREACAKVCDLVAREMDDTNGTTSYIGKLIRARGQA